MVSVRIKISFDLKRASVSGVQIPLSNKVFGSKVVWLDLSYERFLLFHYHCGMLIHETKMNMSSSRMNVRFGDRNSSFS